MKLINKNNEREKNILKIIPLYELYMEYMIQLIIKLPRTEKFSIGNEFKNVMYDIYIYYILYLGHFQKLIYRILSKINHTPTTRVTL